ncbi:hypothetical protein [Noviluteimonas gilva]|uniref:Uncharacterized protein n=1 Tax=Noviluteimonas gilva TaxID=2682097 RepID=A0A7C9HVE4_9GAMM|nr:hypothetical protein [Lysobacter gilvus]MUV14378.1 hypothetical protein [Lysobacter gilvus]
MPWLRWLLAAFAIASPVIFLAHMLRDRPLHYAISEALVWGGITAWVYVVGRIYNARRGRKCALCEEPSRGGE